MISEKKEIKIRKKTVKSVFFTISVLFVLFTMYKALEIEGLRNRTRNVLPKPTYYSMELNDAILMYWTFTTCILIIWIAIVIVFLTKSFMFLKQNYTIKLVD